MSRRDPDGVCGASIGACVPINEDGWCLTANHLMAEWIKWTKARDAFPEWEKERAKVLAEPKPKKRRQGLKALQRDFPLVLTNVSLWCGLDHLRLVSAKGMPAVDLAVVKLEPADPGWLSGTAVIKDPTQPLRSGTSLCRLGYPLYEINPTFDETRNSFLFPPGTTPLPLFPIEGIMTRTVEIQAKEGQAGKLIETSSPGLRGQSGGPIFDVHGVLWGIQSLTKHFPLGFEPEVKAKNGAVTVEHQFLNVGWGAHPETICKFLDSEGIGYEIAS